MTGLTGEERCLLPVCHHHQDSVAGPRAHLPRQLGLGQEGQLTGGSTAALRVAQLVS